MADVRLDKIRYAELLKAERDLLGLLSDYDRLEECGVDCTDLRELNRTYVDRIVAIKKNYSPKATL